MTINPQDNPQATPAAETNPKEDSLAKQRKMYERQLEQNRQALAQLEAENQQLKMQSAKKPINEDDDEDDSDEPYVDKRRLEKKLSRFESRLDEKIDRKAEEKARKMVEQERQQSWLRSNPDFEEVMTHANTLAEKDPEWAETILRMPEGFERQKLVYKTIKTAGLHKKEEPKPSIQEKIDQNRRSPYYQPTGLSGPGYGMLSGGKDYSESEKQNAYNKLKELKSKLRI